MVAREDELMDTFAVVSLGSMPADGWRETRRTVSGDRLLATTEALAGHDGFLDRLGEIRSRSPRAGSLMRC